MDRETQKLVEGLGPAGLEVLEISGNKWAKASNFRRYLSVGFPKYDVCHAPLDDRFDLIIAEQVCEHLVSPSRATRHVYDMLKEGGYFLVTTPFMLRIHEMPHDCSRWSEEGLRYHLADCGFPPDRIISASWGNKRCVVANLSRWTPYRRWFHSLKDEPDFPVVVWALAQK